MAEVYAKQGYTAIALNIYKRIFQKNPSDLEAQKRISELETKLSSRREKFTESRGNST
jgi:dienelactone hydrolase